MKHAGRTEKAANVLSKRIHDVISGIAPGSAPGSVRVRPGASPSAVTVIVLTEEEIIERTGVTAEEAARLAKKETLSWIHVDGLADAHVVEFLMKEYSLHPLAVEDMMNPHQRPKLDDYGGSLFMSLRLPGGVRSDEAAGQLNLFVLKDMVISFREGGDPAPVLAVQERLRKEAFNARVRMCGSDFLAYSLLDAVVDYFYVALEQAGERLEALENVVLTAASPAIVSEIRGAKRDLLSMRRSVWPMRDVVSELQRDETSLVTEEYASTFRMPDHVPRLDLSKPLGISPPD